MDESLASPENPPSADEAISLCAADVRRFDPDRYFTCLFAGEEGRRALVSLYAFNLEIAKTRESVSEPMLGRIRLQWWREAIGGIYAGTPRNHAVVTALAETVTRCGLSRDRFDRMIEGREFDLEDRQPETVEELVAYAGATSGELTCLVLEALGESGAKIFEAGYAAGIGWALIGLLRAAPFHAAQGRCFLPRSVIDSCGVSLHDLFAGRPTVNLTDAVAVLARVASGYIEAGRGNAEGRARNLHAGLAPLALARGDLKRLAREGYDVFALTPQSPMLRQWCVIRAVYSGRF